MVWGAGLGVDYSSVIPLQVGTKMADMYSVNAWDGLSFIYFTTRGVKFDQATNDVISDESVDTSRLYWMYLSGGATDIRRAFVTAKPLTTSSFTIGDRYVLRYGDLTSVNIFEMPGYPASHDTDLAGLRRLNPDSAGRDPPLLHLFNFSSDIVTAVELPNSLAGSSKLVGVLATPVTTVRTVQVAATSTDSAVAAVRSACGSTFPASAPSEVAVVTVYSPAPTGTAAWLPVNRTCYFVTNRATRRRYPASFAAATVRGAPLLAVAVPQALLSPADEAAAGLEPLRVSNSTQGIPDGALVGLTVALSADGAVVQRTYPESEPLTPIAGVGQSVLMVDVSTVAAVYATPYPQSGGGDGTSPPPVATVASMDVAFGRTAGLPSHPTVVRVRVGCSAPLCVSETPYQFEYESGRAPVVWSMRDVSSHSAAAHDTSASGDNSTVATARGAPPDASPCGAGRPIAGTRLCSVATTIIIAFGGVSEASGGGSNPKDAATGPLGAPTSCVWLGGTEYESTANYSAAHASNAAAASGGDDAPMAPTAAAATMVVPTVHHATDMDAATVITAAGTIALIYFGHCGGAAWAFGGAAVVHRPAIRGVCTIAGTNVDTYTEVYSFDADSAVLGGAAALTAAAAGGTMSVGGGDAGHARNISLQVRIGVSIMLRPLALADTLRSAVVDGASAHVALAEAAVDELWAEAAAEIAAVKAALAAGAAGGATAQDPVLHPATPPSVAVMAPALFDIISSSAAGRRRRARPTQRNAGAGQMDQSAVPAPLANALAATYVGSTIDLIVHAAWEGEASYVLVAATPQLPVSAVPTVAPHLPPDAAALLTLQTAALVAVEPAVGPAFPPATVAAMRPAVAPVAIFSPSFIAASSRYPSYERVAATTPSVKAALAAANASRLPPNMRPGGGEEQDTSSQVIAGFLTALCFISLVCGAIGGCINRLDLCKPGRGGAGAFDPYAAPGGVAAGNEAGRRQTRADEGIQVGAHESL